MDNETTTKTCRECGKNLDISQFWKSKRSKDGRATLCKQCSSQHRKHYRPIARKTAILYKRIDEHKKKFSDKIHERNYGTEENHEKYKADQRDQIKRWLQLPENAAAHYARTSVVAVMDYLRKRRSVKMHNPQRISIAGVVLYHARDLQLPLDQIQVDHIIPLVHLSRFLILEKGVDKKTAVKIMNSQPNLRLIEKTANRHKYDLITKESLTAAIHLEDAYECCKGLGEFLKNIMKLQKEWGASLCKIRKNPEERIQEMNEFKKQKAKKGATK